MEIGNNVFIAEGAKVVGQVTLGDMVNVWYNAVIRGDANTIVIGEKTNIQDNCVLHVQRSHSITIGSGCTIGHGAIVHACTIGDNTLIGMGSIILSGAIIGSNCIIGAGAVVTEGTVIPDNSVVLGLPGKFRRMITPHEIEENRISADYYLELAEIARHAVPAEPTVVTGR